MFEVQYRWRFSSQGCIFAVQHVHDLPYVDNKGNLKLAKSPVTVAMHSTH